MDLKRVSKIHPRYTEIINGYTRQVQAMFPDDNSYYNIVDLIKHIILLYYYCLFESKILSDDEQEKFTQFLQQNNKNIIDFQWKLIFDSQEDGLKCQTFVDKVHGHQNVIILFLAKGEIIIGGYTKTGWSKELYEKVAKSGEDDFSADKDAFVFHFKSAEGKYPFISNVKQEEKYISTALGYAKGYYGLFGEGWLFCMAPVHFSTLNMDKDNVLDGRDNYDSNNYEMYPYNWTNLLGSRQGNMDNAYWEIADVVIEVYQIEE